MILKAIGKQEGLGIVSGTLEYHDTKSRLTFTQSKSQYEDHHNGLGLVKASLLKPFRKEVELLSLDLVDLLDVSIRQASDTQDGVMSVESLTRVYKFHFKKKQEEAVTAFCKAIFKKGPKGPFFS